MKTLFKLYCFSMLFPAFSVLYLLIGFNVQNRILWLPFGVLFFLNYKYGTCLKVDIPIFSLCFFFLTYIFVAVVNSWNVPMYIGYFLTFLLIFFTNFIVRDYKDLFLKFFKLFFVLNLCYVIYQLVCLNLGFDSLAMIHSNLPAQEAAGYTIPTFISKPFYRYTGLFNESSPFTFYLSISYCFFSVLNGCKTYKRIALLLLLFSGAKFAYLFLLIHAFFFMKSKIIKLSILSFMLILVSLFLYYSEDLIRMTNGEVVSVFSRLDHFGESSSLDTAINYWGVGLQESSEGKVSLDFFSILTTGFGFCGLILIFTCIVSFYRLVNNGNKKFFCIPFFLGLTASGSFLILQYSLLSYCLMYLHNSNLITNNKKNEI